MSSMELQKMTSTNEIKISFTGRLDTGDIFMVVPPDEPMVIVLGQSELPPTVEKTVADMKKGETRKVRIAPEEGYGHRMKDLLHELPKAVFGDDAPLKPGMIVSQKIEKDGSLHQVPATIIELKNDMVVIDYNHPLAGHHLTYEITVID
jgi:FKBP-type peptidyl-prolyl cis-trans isomerase 2